MAKVNIIITDAGLAEIVNAENNGTAPVVLETIAVGTGKYTPSASQTSLISEIKRFYSISGGAIGDNVIHINAEDASDEAYTVYELGVFTDSGTLFAVTSQSTPIISKAKAAQMALAIDIALTNINPDSITFGDTNFIINSATTERQGIIELATTEEAKAATDSFRAITPKTLDEVIEAHDNIVHRKGNETIAGNKTFTESIISSAAQSFIRSTDTSSLLIVGATTWEKGGHLVLRGADSANDPGIFSLAARGDVSKLLSGSPDGKLTWDGKNIVRTVNDKNADANGNITPEQTGCLPLTGGTMTGAITLDGTASVFAADRDLWFAHSTGNTSYRAAILSGDTYNTGASLYMHGKDYSNNPGQFCLQAHDGTNLSALVGNPDGMLVWKNLVFASGYIKKNDTTSGLNVCSGRAYNDSPAISLYPSDYSDANMAGRFVLRSGENKYQLTGKQDGTLQWNGTSLSLSGTIKTSVNQALVKTDTKGGIQVCGGTNLEDGGSILGYGMNYELNPEFKGALRLQAMDGTNKYDVVLFPKGRLRLGNGTRMNFQDNEDQHIFVDAHGDLLQGDMNGAFIRICGMDSGINPGGFQLRAKGENSDPVYLIGKPDGTLTWEGTQLPVPTGTVIAFAANANPEGYVICNGSAVSRTVYARLFAVIGTTYGAGDGSTTFNLPNLTGRFIEGASAVGVYKEAGLPNITGAAGIGDNASGSKLLAMNECSGALGPSAEGTQFSYSNTYSTAGQHKGGLAFNAGESNAIYGRSETVQPPALTMRYFIKW